MASEDLQPCDGTRQRTLTEKGLSYQRELKEKEQKKILKELDKLSSDLNELLSESKDYDTVKNCYSRWLSVYEDLLLVNEDCLELTHPDEVEETISLFERTDRKYKDLKKLCEHWFLSNNPPSPKRTKTVSERSFLSRNSASSQISQARLKEAQRQAELKARVSVLKEKQRLEENKPRLKMEEEALQLNTELQVSDARAKAIDQLERSITQKEEDLKELKNENDRKPNQLAHTETNGEIDIPLKRERYESHSGQFNRNSHERDINPIINVTRELNKPKAEIDKFYESALDYHRFLRQFETRINSSTDSYEERLNYLLQFTGGEAHKIVLGYSNLKAERGFKAAMDEFNDRYGNPEIIAQTYIKRVLEWPPIKSDNAQALDEFAIFLRECQFVVEDVKCMQVLEYSENLKIILRKLPYYLHDKWRNIIYDLKVRKEQVTFGHLVSFIRREAKKANDPIYGRDIISTSSTAKGNKQTKIQNRSKSSSKTLATNMVENRDSNQPQNKSSNESSCSPTCLYCNGSHYLYACENITKLSLKDRYMFLKTKGLCFGCLKNGHMKTLCRNKLKCGHCQRYHPSILHADKLGQNNQNDHNNNELLNATSSATHMGAGKPLLQALPIVPVRLKAKSGDKCIETYAFLDSGSTASFCSERISRILNLEGRKTKIKLFTMGQSKDYVTQELSGLEISSLDGSNVLDLPPLYTRPNLPVSKNDVASNDDLKNWSHLKDISLVEIDSQVDLLIGINAPRAMEPWDVVPSENGGPFAIKTIFGWVVNGPIDVTSDCSSQTIAANYIKTEVDLQEQVKNYFNLDFCERIIDDVVENSLEDKRFLDIVKTSTVKEHGHYCIDLPFRNDRVFMPNNRKQALQRLSILNKRFEKNCEFRDHYFDFMEKVIAKGYAQRTSQNEDPEEGQIWYLPHHGVYHPKKKRIRVVFDCAAKFQGTSLNDQLLQGPNMTNSLVGTLLRFRQEEVAIMGDIESMFYQVRVSPKHRGFQRFLWWENRDTGKPPVEFQMIVHLFGSSSSPSCANYALRRTAEDSRGQFHEDVIQTVKRNFYVDDCLRSLPTVLAATNMIKELQAMLQGGGFHLSKWVSNNRVVVNSIPIDDRAVEIKDIDLDKDEFPMERTLGVNWLVNPDDFSFTIDIKDKPHTRRGILSTISSIYDPLGFISPLVLGAKSLLQELCQQKLDWDETIPDKYSVKWSKWLENVQNISNYKLSRCLKPAGFGQVASCELHHFTDASETGYGTVSYLRLINMDGNVHCSFVMGKSRVAPLKKMTVTRLELTAATVAVRTDKTLKRELDMMIDNTFYWTDSMSVLRYINNSTSRFQTFVSNRLVVIHEGSNIEQWNFISTKLNPADVASRGLAINEQLWLKRWINAPDFLLENQVISPDRLPERLTMIENDPEIKKVNVTRTDTKSDIDRNKFETINNLLQRYSSWYRLKKGVAWILKIKHELLKRARFKRYGKQACFTDESSNLESVSIQDLCEAENAILQYVQQHSFLDEINCLKNGQIIKKSSSLRKLDPVFRNGLLRVGGRLQKSCIAAESMHPVILPKGHYVSMLILRGIHENINHAGRNHMLSKLRERYWLINAPSCIRKLIKQCTMCRRLRSPVGEQKMSVLPVDRVTPCEPPFTRVGVDYFGPFEVKVKRSRVKRYGVIFTCLASRAIHLEMAFALDTDSYIHALRRFIARRGQVAKIWSDNGTNLVGAERELRQAIKEWNIKQVHEEMLQKNIEWKFNPPAGSHHGGVWERLIRSVRNSLNFTLRNQMLTDESFMTFLCEVEAILNDRPITKVSDQANDLEALTPNHILHLKHKPNLPPGLFQQNDCYYKRRWRQVQYMSNIFWKRWVREYLPLLQERQKWHVQRRNIMVGDIVVIMDPNAPRNSWPLAKVIETLPDHTGLVRQVKVRTATNVLIRPVDKLVLTLEMDCISE